MCHKLNENWMQSILLSCKASKIELPLKKDPRIILSEWGAKEYHVKRPLFLGLSKYKKVASTNFTSSFGSKEKRTRLLTYSLLC